jgi:hypothetical protein
MAEYVSAVAAALPCPVDLVAVAALGAAAAAIGNARHLAVKAGWIEGPRLWCAVVCAPGTKKSPALAAATRPLREAQRQLQRAFQAECTAVDTSAVSCPGRLRPAPRMQQLFTGDTTREGLTALLQDNPRGLALISDELSGWALSLNQYKRGKGDDRQFWLSLWSGSEILVNRARDRGRPTAYVPAPMLSILGCLPPAALKQLLDPPACEDGFADRILFSWPTAASYGWTEAVVEPRVEKSYQALFHQLLNLAGSIDPLTGEEQPVVLGWTDPGRRAWVAYAEQLAATLNSPEHPPQLRGPWAKMEGYGARLALVLHVCRQAASATCPDDVDEQSMFGAARLIAYFQSHARRVYARLAFPATECNDSVQAVLDWLRRHRKEFATLPRPHFSWRRIRRDLQNRFAGRGDVLRRALAELEAKGLLRTVPRSAPATGRRPEPDYLVHPELVSTDPPEGWF